MQSTEIFPGIFIGDIVVSIKKFDYHRDAGDLFEVLPNSRPGALHYEHTTNSRLQDHWRKATEREVAWYKSAETNRNINNMPKEEIIDGYAIY